MTEPSAQSPLAQRLADIRARMARAATAAGRDPSGITLVAVTKTHAAPVLADLFSLGQLDVGENRVQEFLAKHRELAGRGSWHFIGHLQTNKVAQVVGRVGLIHSVDSPRLIAEIEKRAAAAGIIQRVLLEINIGGEAAKTGATPGELPDLIKSLASAPHVRAEGLMTVPPYSHNPEDSRPYFRRLRELMRAIPPTEHFHPDHLSMGMSGDFEVALAEGATMIRIGTALLGDRS